MSPAPRLYRSKYVDPGILPLVHALQRAGFPTCYSCQGGYGHQFKRPTVEIATEAEDRTQMRVALGGWLRDMGVASSTKFEWVHLTSNRKLPMARPRWRLTFYRLPDTTKL